MQKNQIIYGVLSLIAVFAFLFGVYYFTNASGAIDTTQLEVKSTDHIKWAKDSNNVLIEYSDLQCPACKQFQDGLIKVIENDKSADAQKIRSNIKFVYRHFPLSIHPNAEEASYAAEAAGEQGKFFEMVELLFTKQGEWSGLGNPDAKFLEYAKSLKLDEKKFTTAYKSEKVRDTVSADVQSGGKVNVQGTPTFYLNGQKVNLNDMQAFKQLLVQTANQK